MATGLGYKIWTQFHYIAVGYIFLGLIHVRYLLLPALHNEVSCCHTKQLKIIFLSLRDCDTNKINYMYAQYVKNTMEPLNIPDVCKDRRFPWTVSKISLHLKFRIDFFLSTFQIFLAFPSVFFFNLMATVRIPQTQRKVQCLLYKILYQWRNGTILTQWAGYSYSHYLKRLTFICQ